MLIALPIEREVHAPVVVSNAQLDFWGEEFLAIPANERKGITFERFLMYQVRNGALFQKIRCPQAQRRNDSAHFRPRKEAL